jgi:hypothetical protein
LFLGVVAALALAFGLAFGLGGRDVAAQLTQDWYAQMQSTAARVQAHQAEAASRPQGTVPPAQTGAVGATSPASAPNPNNPSSATS